MDSLVAFSMYIVYFLGVGLMATQTVSAAVRSFRLRKRLSSVRTVALFPEDAAFVKTLPVSLVFGIAALMVSGRYFSFANAVLVTAGAAAIPILLLRVKRGNDKRRSGREGLSLVTDIYRHYRVKNRNIYEALDAAASDSKRYPVSSKQLAAMLMRLRDAGSRDEVKEACRKYSKSNGRLWGRMLAACIQTSVLTGADVSQALSDIIEQLDDEKKLTEERRRLNSEAVRMTVFLVPLLYAGTMLIASRFMSLSLSDLLRNQFASPIGLMLFILCVFLFLVDVIILQAVDSGGQL